MPCVRRGDHREAVGCRAAQVEFHVVVGLEHVGGGRLADRLDFVGLLGPEVGREQEVLLDVGLYVGRRPRCA